MTQVKCAQRAGKELALRLDLDGRSLAQRRADFAAQMREMALSDLKQVSDRLKHLHERLDHKDGRRWKQYELAAAMDIPPRTFQSWENGEVENSDGEGYDKIARFYNRRLGEKITRKWILFGDEEEAEEVREPEEPSLQRVFEMLTQLGATVDGLVGEVQELKQQLPGSDEASDEPSPPPPS